MILLFILGMHDVYGISDFQDTPFKMSNGLIELPMSTVKIFSKAFPFGGGQCLDLFLS